MKSYRIHWLTYTISGQDLNDAERRAKEFVKHNADNLIVDIEESRPKRGPLARIFLGD